MSEQPTETGRCMACQQEVKSYFLVGGLCPRCAKERNPQEGRQQAKWMGQYEAGVGLGPLNWLIIFGAVAVVAVGLLSGEEERPPAPLPSQMAMVTPAAPKDEELRFGLTGTQREAVWREAIEAKYRAGAEAKAKHGDFTPEMAALSNRLRKRYQASVAKAHKLSPAQLDAIIDEGVEKNWPPPELPAELQPGTIVAEAKARKVEQILAGAQQASVEVRDDFGELLVHPGAWAMIPLSQKEAFLRNVAWAREQRYGGRPSEGYVRVRDAFSGRELGGCDHIWGPWVKE